MDLGHLWLDTVQWQAASGFSDGDVSYGALTSATGRLEETYKIINQAGGQERVARYQFATASDIPIRARVYVPDASAGTPDHSLVVLERHTARTLDGSYRYYIYWFGT